MEEADLKYALIVNPSLIEEGLIYKDREVNLNGGRCDLLYEDKDGNELYVEAKIRALDNAAGQIMRYEHLVNNASARFMVVGLSFLDGLKEALVIKNYEYRHLMEDDVQSIIDRMNIVLDLLARKNKSNNRKVDIKQLEDWDVRFDVIDDGIKMVSRDLTKLKEKVIQTFGDEN